MNKLKHINKMASLYRHATLLTSINHNLFVYILIALIFSAHEGSAKTADEIPSADEGKRLTKEYHLRQGALRGFIVKPSRQYQLQNLEIFLGIPYAAPPVGNLRFMPPGSALPWPGVKLATHFAPVCPQALPAIKKNNPPSLGRQHYMNRLIPFLRNESEDCLNLNIYVPYREQKSKKFPVLVFIHGDSFEWSSGNPYDGRILASYGNIMVITVNFRLGILGFMKPSLTEHVYGNSGLLDQLAALQWIKDNIADLNGDPNSVTLAGHGTGAAALHFLMMSPISTGLFHRAILMSGSALSDWALVQEPMRYTLQVAQALGCSPSSKDMMSCLQSKTVTELKKVQIVSAEFETPLGPVVAGSFIPSEPANTMKAFPNLLSKYQLLCGVSEWESYHDFGAIELSHGVLDDQRNGFLKKYAKIVFGNGEDVAYKDILKHYAPSKLDPQRWSVEMNRDFILDVFSDARTIAPMIRTANFHSKANRQSYFYVFGHNSESTEYAALDKSVNGEELPYVLGIPLGGATSHFHSDYTLKEKLLSEVIMRLWTNFVKIGTPNTQRKNEYYTSDHGDKNKFNIDWPEYNVEHQSYLRIDVPPNVSSYYRSNFTMFWIETLPNKMKKYVIDPLIEYNPANYPPRTKQTNRPTDDVRRIVHPPLETPHHSSPTYGQLRPYSPPRARADTEVIYREIQAIKTPSRAIPSGLMEKPTIYSTTVKSVTRDNVTIKSSSSTYTIVIVLGLLFLLANVAVCSVLYFKKRKLRLRERTFQTSRHTHGDIDMCDGVIKSCKEDKSALQTFKNGCSVFKSIKITKIRNGNSRNKKTKLEPCKTPKSDYSGGFRERFQLRRHLSTSTLDAHTKVRDWIASEVMHRCSPAILRKSNSDIRNDKQLCALKPYTRSEELITDVKVKNSESKNTCNNSKKSNIKNKGSSKVKTSEKTTSTSALGSHSSINTNKQSNSLSSVKQETKSNDSLKSKSAESVKSKKISVAIDATPSARTNSILSQEPIEISKSLDIIENLSKHSDMESTSLRRHKTEGEFMSAAGSVNSPNKSDNNKTFTSVINMAVKQNVPPLTFSHKHSTSDPVTDQNYDKSCKMTSDFEVCNIIPPVSFRNDINVTSRDECIQTLMSPAEALLTIQRRKYPKVLPDLPKSQKRLSLQPSSFQSFRNFSGSIENQTDRSRIPPQPPPRTTTLDRRLAYRHSKPNYLSSFEGSNYRPKESTDNANFKNYENIDSLTAVVETVKNISSDLCDTGESTNRVRQIPKIIIASNDIKITPEIKIIKSLPSDTTKVENIPRVRLPDDFHSHTTGSVTSFSSFCSDEDDDNVDDDFIDDIEEDKLIQELVGGVDSPTNLETRLDSKGPSTIFEKKLEVVPVKINTNTVPPKNREHYVCITDITLPDVTDLEKTAQIKPNFSLNKLKHRSESINTPPEKSVKMKSKKNIKPTTILNRSLRSKDSKKVARTKSSLEHSNSGSSNDTETSTGTVKRVEPKRDK